MLTEQDFFRAAKILRCRISRIKAVYDVEAAGRGYLSDGRVKILFEGHRFWKALVKAGKNPVAFLQGTPNLKPTDPNYIAPRDQYRNILYKDWDKTQYKGGAAEWLRFHEATEICKILEVNTILALDCCSFGSFQIMGENATKCGYANSHEMLSAYDAKGENEQLEGFCKFLINTKLDDELRDGNWAGFAKGYNGTAYRKNMYDLKLKAADEKYSRAA